MRGAVTLILVLAVIAGTPSCVKLDFFLFAGESADLEDYDFESEKYDGIDPARISSELIPVGEAGEEIHVIFIERDVSKLDPRLDPDDGLTVVFSHGNLENMLKYIYRLGYWEDMGFNVLMYDYRGYGASSGETTEHNVYEDVEAAYDHAVAQPGVGLVVAAGYSMGGAPTIWLCSEGSGRDVAACFVESTFTGTDQLVDDSAYYDFEGSWFVDTAFDNVGRIGHIDTPFLIMHGDRDPTVDVTNGRRLWKAAKDNHPANRYFEVDGATHRNVPLPSYQGPEPREYSHPDELPADLRDELRIYQDRILDFVVDAIAE